MNFLLRHRELALGADHRGDGRRDRPLCAGVRVARRISPTVLNDTSILFMLVLAQMVVILTRGIDLSVAANLALSGMISASLAQHFPDLPVIAYIATGVAVGVVLGLFNGGLIAGVGIPPIVVTLGTLAIFRGLIVVYGGGSQVNASEMGDVFQAFPKLTLLGLDTVFWIAAPLAVSVRVCFSTSLARARNFYALGGNPLAARYCGIDIRDQLLAGLCRLRAPSRVSAAISGWRAMASPIRKSRRATS